MTSTFVAPLSLHPPSLRRPPHLTRATPRCSLTPPTSTTDPQTAYQTAKRAYKAVKHTSTPAELLALKRRKKDAKALYKAAKRTAVTNIPDILMQDGVRKATMQVCGGKACVKLGAEAVAGVMKCEMVDGCRKMCGGGGPTVVLENGRCVKVDIRQAVMRVVEEGMSGE